jgi:hypothetical protein
MERTVVACVVALVLAVCGPVPPRRLFPGRVRRLDRRMRCLRMAVVYLCIAACATPTRQPEAILAPDIGPTHLNSSQDPQVSLDFLSRTHAAIERWHAKHPTLAQAVALAALISAVYAATNVLHGRHRSAPSAPMQPTKCVVGTVNCPPPPMQPLIPCATVPFPQICQSLFLISGRPE